MKGDFMAKLDARKIKKDFPILGTKMNGKVLAYLDSAATSQKPKQVIDSISYYYKNYNANIHRGIYKISEKATEAYTKSKEDLAKFINAKSYREVVFLRNATEAINLVALSWGDANVKRGDHILTTPMEHHSNMVPWQLLAKRKGAHLDYANLSENSFIDMEDLGEKLEMEPKIVAITEVSNVLGTINDVKKITEMAHKAGAVVLIDGAQSAPHMKVDVQKINCDFFAFSGHKMLAPSGIGALYGKEDVLDLMNPLFGGGEMIRSVTLEGATWNDLPWKFEAGTQNIEGAIGFGEAIGYLNKIGMDKVRKHEEDITRYAMEKLGEIDRVKIYGPTSKQMNKRGGIVSFSVDGIHPHDVSQVFDSEGIAIRSGHHCAMPLVTQMLGNSALSRMSFYIYNEREDIDRAVHAIHKAKRIFGK